jgi:hypothetical protein
MSCCHRRLWQTMCNVTLVGNGIQLVRREFLVLPKLPTNSYCCSLEQRYDGVTSATDTSLANIVELQNTPPPPVSLFFFVAKAFVVLKNCVVARQRPPNTLRFSKHVDKNWYHFFDCFYICRIVFIFKCVDDRQTKREHWPI